MSRARVCEVSALVIRQRDSREADRLLTLFTRDLGKLSAVARGVKKPHSKLAPMLQLFSQARLQLLAGRSLNLVVGARLERGFPLLRENVERYACACYVAELCDVMTEERAAAEWVFELLAATMGGLDAGGDMAALVRGFELKLLSGLGYGPELEVCVCCGAEVGERAAGFSVSEGGVVCQRCARAGGASLSAAALLGLRDLVRLSQEELGARRLREKTRQELARLVRGFVDYRLERPLRSAAFLPK